MRKYVMGVYRQAAGPRGCDRRERERGGSECASYGGTFKRYVFDEHDAQQPAKLNNVKQQTHCRHLRSLLQVVSRRRRRRNTALARGQFMYELTKCGWIPFAVLHSRRAIRGDWRPSGSG